MNYLLFNNEILISDGRDVRRIGKGDDLKADLGSIDQAKICVVDVDVLITASVEFPIEKKDSILVRKFKEFHQHEAYVIQDERIDHNLFQVIGIKEQKVREIYELIPSQKVESLIPYGIALRNTLIGKGVDLNKNIVFVDDLGSDRLLTVFDGLKFSRTRVIANNGEDILPEIKRSQIDFFKKTEEFLSNKNSGLVILVNNQVLVGQIAGNSEKLQVEFLNILYPALEGLKSTEDHIKYRLPEEDLRKRREIELKKRMIVLCLSLSTVLASLFYFLINRMDLAHMEQKFVSAKKSCAALDARLGMLDKETYREDLRSHKFLNYGVSYLSILEMIPASYTVNSFKFSKTGQWNVEMILFASSDGPFDPIPLKRILKNAAIKDIYVNNQPGKFLRVAL